ncbi:hypothetical protein BP5796_04511 [Coleophoma crateriformis]|uniref:Uncharacterized protein n=1 Tax=Coleophoma crateriformis TaxID=565419 RepID=A0A3D8S9T6_9HELO|nr:hypothetical protein BP5796_04511 [Coleophoma crateriformis]
MRSSRRLPRWPAKVGPGAQRLTARPERKLVVIFLAKLLELNACPRPPNPQGITAVEIHGDQAHGWLTQTANGRVLSCATIVKVGMASGPEKVRGKEWKHHWAAPEGGSWSTGDSVNLERGEAQHRAGRRARGQLMRQREKVEDEPRRAVERHALLVCFSASTARRATPHAMERALGGSFACPIHHSQDSTAHPKQLGRCSGLWANVTGDVGVSLA